MPARASVVLSALLVNAILETSTSITQNRIFKVRVFQIIYWSAKQFEFWYRKRIMRSRDHIMQQMVQSQKSSEIFSQLPSVVQQISMVGAELM
jgi:hypothetical protein